MVIAQKSKKNRREVQNISLRNKKNTHKSKFIALWKYILYMVNLASPSYPPYKNQSGIPDKPSQVQNKACLILKPSQIPQYQTPCKIVNLYLNIIKITKISLNYKIDPICQFNQLHRNPCIDLSSSSSLIFEAPIGVRSSLSPGAPPVIQLDESGLAWASGHKVLLSRIVTSCTARTSSGALAPYKALPDFTRGQTAARSKSRTAPDLHPSLPSSSYTTTSSAVRWQKSDDKPATMKSEATAVLQPAAESCHKTIEVE